MKIKTAEMNYENVLALQPAQHIQPRKPWYIFRLLLKLLSASELKKVHFQCRKIGMNRLKPDEPCLILMNHSSFIDLKIASTVLYPRSFNIICTLDGFVGKEWLMRAIGCIPTKKFLLETNLVRDMVYTVRELKSSILMYPEASYSFDGTATPLPESIGKCLKMLKVPVIIIRTYGAFTRDPLYNSLQLRKVDVSADMEYLLSPTEISEKTSGELNEILAEKFSFDHFRWQQENKIQVTEPFRADDLNRVLYKCPHCKTEGRMQGKGIRLICNQCKKEYELTKEGYMKACEGETEFDHIPDWYQWERESVRRELMEGTYLLDIPVEIRVLVNTKCIYKIGNGRLVHAKNGFRLTGCDGKLCYEQGPGASYSLYSDFCWYEIGDMICIGDRKLQYYCFPQNCGDVVAKARLAAEELYKMTRKRRGHCEK